MEIKLSKSDFDLFRDFIYDEAGISLSDKKVTLVQGRLAKRLRALGLGSFKEYYKYLKTDRSGTELFFLIDAISTNVTSFFRERAQWDFLEEHLDEILGRTQHKKLRIWSAACSSGEEPYSIAMFLHEHIHDINSWNIKILATDISKDILRRAIRGQYAEQNLKDIPKYILNRYFEREAMRGGANAYHIRDFIKQMVFYRMFNLVYGNFNIFKTQFDIIFCRNVMIYFDAETREKLVKHFYRILKPQGMLFVGHSESLTRSKENLKLRGSSIYQKN